MIEAQLGQPPAFVRRGRPGHREAGPAGAVSSDFVDPRIGIAGHSDRLGATPYVLMLATMIVDPDMDLDGLAVYRRWAPHVRRFSYGVPPRIATVI